jgi:hypothetical protein
MPRCGRRRAGQRQGPRGRCCCFSTPAASPAGRVPDSPPPPRPQAAAAKVKALQAEKEAAAGNPYLEYVLTKQVRPPTLPLMNHQPA